jgi:hypothetical protein
VCEYECKNQCVSVSLNTNLCFCVYVRKCVDVCAGTYVYALSVCVCENVCVYVTWSTTLCKTMTTNRTVYSISSVSLCVCVCVCTYELSSGTSSFSRVTWICRIIAGQNATICITCACVHVCVRMCVHVCVWIYVCVYVRVRVCANYVQ